MSGVSLSMSYVSLSMSYVSLLMSGAFCFICTVINWLVFKEACCFRHFNTLIFYIENSFVFACHTLHLLSALPLLLTALPLLLTALPLLLTALPLLLTALPLLLCALFIRIMNSFVCLLQHNEMNDIEDSIVDSNASSIDGVQYPSNNDVVGM